MKNYNLCVSLNPEEKAIVCALAAQHNMKPTAYVKSLICSQKPKQSKPVIFIPSAEVNYAIGSKSQCIKAYFTDNEMMALRHMAKNEPLSRFVSRRALQGENVLSIEIEDDDYDFVYSVVEPIYTSIYMYLHNLKSINALEKDVIENIISELEKSNRFLIKLTEYLKKNRRSIRKTRLNELRKLSNYLLKDYDLFSV